jgi:hypothetical protein
MVQDSEKAAAVPEGSHRRFGISHVSREKTQSRKVGPSHPTALAGGEWELRKGVCYGGI